MLNLAEKWDREEASFSLKAIECVDQRLFRYYQDKIKIDPALSRQLVSFQANKVRPAYRWYKYKEAFSASLVEYLLRQLNITSGCLLDPFAGSGTALFAASQMGLNTEGIELLPIGQQIIQTRLFLEQEFTDTDYHALLRWKNEKPWTHTANKHSLLELRITKGAYPPETVDAIERFIDALESETVRVKAVLRFALLCVLESISYTRKDGQYLRWDYRSGRRQGAKQFNKGKILHFDQAIEEKLEEILSDTYFSKELTCLFPSLEEEGKMYTYFGSCLHVMPTLPGESYDVIVTSPPYCNRYDYTRTYALELALLGINEENLIKLRQEMLSCTVENRAKDLVSLNKEWREAIEITNRQELLQLILEYLEDQKSLGALNNNGIPRMVKGYFYEMSCVIFECYRLLKPGARLCMVNDNVRYAGASVSVDLILSAIAEGLGFQVDQIHVLPNGKGNSSQQMGEHGRESLRKCVYVWRK